MKSMPGKCAVTTAAVLSVFLNIPLAFAAPDAAAPEAQAWIDIATFSGMGMPLGGNPMSAMFGGKSASGNSFGNTRTMSAGRWVDVTLRSRANPNLDEAQQAVPDGWIHEPGPGTESTSERPCGAR